MVFFWPFWWYGEYALWSIVWDLAGIILFAVFLYLFFRNKSLWHPYKNKESTACEILKRRYAAGEITKAEYEEIKKDLGCK
ncbi:SHOCT domain-containing protein [Mesoaciditoga lauensis]|uniref:SHOCT domain-containing protein n=1 Tax=Mesoaciditoga lauensis TaxID=1495039 RepID=UPI000559DA2C|nr:SHOCT domain-containing protein [Mesoaciditoga lauensis]